MHEQYFSKCNGAGCQLPSNVRYQPLCLEQVKKLISGSASSINSACLLGNNYLFPWLRPDQMLGPDLLQLAAAGALAWECGMFLLVLRPGPLCALGLLAGFMFHQGVRWLTAIGFPGYTYLSILIVPTHTMCAYSVPNTLTGRVYLTQATGCLPPQPAVTVWMAPWAKRRPQVRDTSTRPSGTLQCDVGYALAGGSVRHILGRMSGQPQYPSARQPVSNRGLPPFLRQDGSWPDPAPSRTTHGH